MSKSVYKYSVAIQCMTYNHSKYIEDALNGFIMQNTDFPYVILLVDDASTDGEGKIISEYLDIHFNLGDTSVSYTKETEYAKITYAQHKTNLNCFIVVMYLKYNHYQVGKKYEKLKYISEWLDDSKYIALCEGDDYWIDSLKLHKQVDFLDNHEDYSMCFHNADILNEVGSSFCYEKLDDREYHSHEVFDKWIVPTASIMYKMDALKSVVKDSRIINGDINLILGCTHSGKIYGMSQTMSVYRVQANGITLKRIEDDNIDLQYRYMSHYRCLYENYNQISYRLYSRKISDCYFFLAVAYYKKSQYVRFFINTIISLLYNPCRLINRLLQKAISVK